MDKVEQRLSNIHGNLIFFILEAIGTADATAGRPAFNDTQAGDQVHDFEAWPAETVGPVLAGRMVSQGHGQRPQILGVKRPPIVQCQ